MSFWHRIIAAREDRARYEVAKLLQRVEFPYESIEYIEQRLREGSVARS